MAEQGILGLLVSHLGFELGGVLVHGVMHRGEGVPQAVVDRRHFGSVSKPPPASGEGLGNQGLLIGAQMSPKPEPSSGHG